MPDPVLLFFLVGVTGGLVKSDLRIPESFYHVLSIYLLLSIGIKGGIECQHTGLSQIVGPVVFSMILGVLITFSAIMVFYKLLRFSLADSAAIGAHYGSVSAVTFAVVCSFVEHQNIFYEKYVTVMLVAMEIPAIIAAVLFYKKSVNIKGVPMNRILGEVLSGKSMLCLLGGLVIGYYIGWSKQEQLNFFFMDLFKGFLGLFMIEMGLVASERMNTLKSVGLKLIVFGLVFPLICAWMGILFAYGMDLSRGGATVLGALSASASYIAAPAAVRLAIPDSNPTLYLTSALGITFPFNLTLGIPIYHYWSGLIYL